jgi:hypothetical protein
MERSSPRCRIISFITSNAGDDVNGSVFEIQLHTSRYTISVSPSKFQNSPIRSHELQEYLALLRSEHDAYGDPF